ADDSATAMVSLRCLSIDAIFSACGIRFCMEAPLDRDSYSVSCNSSINAYLFAAIKQIRRRRMIPFAGNPLNRASEKRTDADWIAARRRDPNSYILPMWRLQPFIIGPEKAPAPVELGLLKPGLADSLAG